MRQVPALAGGAASARMAGGGGAGYCRHHRRQPACGAGVPVRGAARQPRRRPRVHRRRGGARRGGGAGAARARTGRPACRRGRCWRIAEPRRRLAQLAAALAGAQPRAVVAVTGTNGKTSTVEFLRQIWAAGGRRGGEPRHAGLIAPGFEPGPGLTTPDPVSLAETLARLARAGVQHAAIEASSHGLDQFRLDGVRLAAAAFTNLTRDHLDYHGHGGRPTAPPSCGCSPNCCRRARRPLRAATWMPRRWRHCARSRARRRLDLRTVGESGTAIRAAGALRRGRTVRC